MGTQARIKRNKKKVNVVGNSLLEATAWPPSRLVLNSVSLPARRAKSISDDLLFNDTQKGAKERSGASEASQAHSEVSPVRGDDQQKEGMARGNSPLECRRLFSRGRQGLHKLCGQP